MPFTQEQIRGALQSFTAVEGRCKEDTERIVCTLLQRCCRLKHHQKCTDVQAALCAIREVFPVHELVPFWPEQGEVNGTYMKHGYIVYSVSPLSSFTVWAGTGSISFFTEKETVEKIRRTIAGPFWKDIDVNEIELCNQRPIRAGKHLYGRGHNGHC